VGVLLTGLSGYLGSFDADTLYVLSSRVDDGQLERLWWD